MRRLVALALACALMLLGGPVQIALVQAAGCESLHSSSFCSSVLLLNYTRSVNVLGPCQDHQENALSQAPELMSVLQNPRLGLPASCAVSVAQYLCVATYPSCSVGNAPPCDSMCATIRTACAPVMALLETFLPGGKLTCAPDVMAAPLCYAPPSGTVDPAYAAVVPSPPRCESYKALGGQACKDVVDTFYLPARTPFAYLESSASTLRFLYNFIDIGSSAGRDCYRSFTRQLCTNLFQGCTDSLMTGVPVPFPKFMCRQECVEYTERCRLPAGVLAQLPPQVRQILAPNCTSVGDKLPATSLCGVPKPGSVAQADFPEHATQFVVDGTTLEATCSAMGADATAAIPIVAHCPYPLLTPNRPQDAIPGTACALPCPLIMYTADEYRATDALMTAFTSVSFVLNTFLMVTWLLFQSKRKQTYIVAFCTTVSFFTFALMLGVWVEDGRPSELNCITSTQEARQEDTDDFCPWQGGMVHTFALSACFWWSVIAFDLFLQLVIGARLTKAQKRVKNIAYFCFASGLPFVLACMTAGLGYYGPNASLSYCFVLAKPKQWVEWVVFWVPVIAACFCGALCIFAIAWTLYRSSKLTGQDKRKGHWRQYVRPMLFLSEFLIIFSFVLAYKFNAKVHQQEYIDGIAAFAACLMGPGGGTQLCGHHPTARPDLSLWRGIHFALGAQGLLNFAVYGTQKNNFTLWINFCFAGLGFSQKGSRDDTGASAIDSANANANANGAGAGGAGSKRKTAAGTVTSGPGTMTYSERKAAALELRTSAGSGGGAGDSQRDLLARQGSILSSARLQHSSPVSPVSPSEAQHSGAGAGTGASMAALQLDDISVDPHAIQEDGPSPPSPSSTPPPPPASVAAPSLTPEQLLRAHTANTQRRRSSLHQPPPPSESPPSSSPSASLADRALHDPDAPDSEQQ